MNMTDANTPNDIIIITAQPIRSSDFGNEERRDFTFRERLTLSKLPELSFPIE